MIPILQMFHLPELELDSLISAAAVVAAMFISMRLLYGRWPWHARQPYIKPPSRQEIRAYAMRELVVAAQREAAVPDTSPPVEDHFDRAQPVDSAVSNSPDSDPR